MFGEVKVFKSNVVGFQIKPQDQEISQVKSIEIQTAAAVEKPVVKKETSFARLKKSLRKRGASIL